MARIPLRPRVAHARVGASEPCREQRGTRLRDSHLIADSGLVEAEHGLRPPKIAFSSVARRSVVEGRCTSRSSRRASLST